MKPAVYLAGFCLFLSILSIFYIDRPVAAFWHAHDFFRRVFQIMAAPSLLPLPCAGLFLVNAIIRRRAAPPSRLFLAASIATLAATAAKDELKWIFGRPWPDTWLDLGIYRLHPFTDSQLFGAFPSGHTSYIAAPLCVFWQLAPRYRRIYAALLASVMFGLVGADYHFVADVLAGLATGLIAAAGTLILLPATESSSNNPQPAAHSQ
jgi:membrane-associated phospholipid phosphatase